MLLIVIPAQAGIQRTRAQRTFGAPGFSPARMTKPNIETVSIYYQK
ncbi:hypothetical protein CbuK_1911 [Coxiella burnetii CbuK_Q154]|nr:hypothetical protein CbuK_1911 [Coxiella burnetii CbuK_Q154]